MLLDVWSRCTVSYLQELKHVRYCSYHMIESDQPVQQKARVGLEQSQGEPLKVFFECYKQQVHNVEMVINGHKIRLLLSSLFYIALYEKILSGSKEIFCCSTIEGPLSGMIDIIIEPWLGYSMYAGHSADSVRQISSLCLSTLLFPIAVLTAKNENK